MENKTSPAQLRATKKWEQANPERKKYNRYKSVAKLFIKSHANNEDLDLFEEMIAKKRKGEEI